MNRPVPFIKIGLRAVALAAILGGQSACVRPTSIATAPNAASRAVASDGVTAANASVIPHGSDESDVPKVVVRDYWGSPRATVVAWAENAEDQGLSGAIRRDGSLALDHIVYFSAYAVPNLSAFYRANWYAFSDKAVSGTVLKQSGMLRDQFYCQGKQGCSPLLSFRARITDEQLRQSHDSLVIKVVSYDGHETLITMGGKLISSYLAKVDSLSIARKAKYASSNHQ